MKNAKRTLFALIALLLLTSVLASCTPASVLGLPLLFPLMTPEDTGSPETTQPEPEENNPPAKPSVFDGIEFSDAATVIPMAFALETGKVLDGTYTLMGQIIESDGYNSQYGDINVTFVVEGYEEYPIYCYQIKKDADKIGIGDYIVHIDHGVGKFGGLVRIPNGNATQEAIKLIPLDVQQSALYRG